MALHRGTKSYKFQWSRSFSIKYFYNFQLLFKIQFYVLRICVVYIHVYYMKMSYDYQAQTFSCLCGNLACLRQESDARNEVFLKAELLYCMRANIRLLNTPLLLILNMINFFIKICLYL